MHQIILKSPVAWIVTALKGIWCTGSPSISKYDIFLKIATWWWLLTSEEYLYYSQPKSSLSLWSQSLYSTLLDKFKTDGT